MQIILKWYIYLYYWCDDAVCVSYPSLNPETRILRMISWETSVYYIADICVEIAQGCEEKNIALNTLTRGKNMPSIYVFQEGWEN